MSIRNIIAFVFLFSGVAMAANNPVYTDNSNGLMWISSLQDKYSNGCNKGNCTFETNADGTRQVKTDDSDAAQACQGIGARLPARSEFESLIRNFDHLEYNNGPELTNNGKLAMANIFGYFMDRAFWTSTVSEGSSPDAAAAYFFFGPFGTIGNGSRTIEMNAWCVQ